MEEDKRMSIGLITQLIFDAATDLYYDRKDKHEVSDDLYNLIHQIEERGVYIRNYINV